MLIRLPYETHSMLYTWKWYEKIIIATEAELILVGFKLVIGITYLQTDKI